MGRTSLRLYDYSDRELLAMMLDEAGDDGWVNTHDLAAALSIDHKHPGQCVGIRLSWLKRYGVVQRKDGSPEWRLTRAGLAQALGKLDPEQQAVLDGLSTEQMLTLTGSLTRRYRRVGETAAHLMRREMTAGIYHRRHG